MNVLCIFKNLCEATAINHDVLLGIGNILQSFIAEITNEKLITVLFSRDELFHDAAVLFVQT